MTIVSAQHLHLGDPDLFRWRSEEEGASRETEEAYRTPLSLGCGRARLLIAAPQHCAGHAATEAEQIRGLFGACSTQHFIALRSCVFFPLSILART
jgi:hypothetical protein